jgi:hypothetical protein
MYSDNDLLDAPTRDSNAKMPPPIVSFEKYFFPTIFVIQYLCLLQMAMAKGFEALIGIMIGGSLLLVTGIWQLIVGFVMYFNDTQHKGRRLYVIFAGINVFVLLLLYMGAWGGVYNNIAIVSSFAFVFIFPHAIAWYYWYLAMCDSQLREKMLNGQG